MESGSSRIAYLDNLRSLLTGLVVLHHTAITYGAPGSWYFYDTALMGVGQILLTVFVALNASFFMGFFFLLAGYFTPRSYDRKGPVRFLWDRLLRLGIPIAFYSFLIAPLIRAMLTVRVWSPGAAFWPTYARYLGDIQFSPGPLWFVLALLIFSAVYVLLRAGSSLFKSGAGAKQRPLTNRGIVLFGLAIGVVTFLVRIVYPSGRVWFVFQLGDFAQYIALYAAGVLAYRHGWFAALTKKQGKQWLLAAVGIAILLPIVGMIGGAFDGDPSEFQGGMQWQSMVGSLWWSMQGLAIILALLVGFRERFNHQGALAREMARSTYTVYILHAPIVVGIGLLLLSTGWHSAVKLPIACIAGLALCFSLAAGVRRIPLARRII